MSQVNQPRLHPKWIDPHAFGIVKALQKNAHETYLVGGCVRDLLLGIEPKDFDIATNAAPDEVRKIIHKAYVIGKRFRLVLVKRDEQQFEVATFRKDIKTFTGEDEDLPSGDNLFGTAEEDAYRRDFTINGLFYDPVKNQLLDYPGGIADLEAGLIRMIGDPTERLIEDPIRILRALRLAHKIGFRIEPDLKMAMKQQAGLLKDAALPRKREEYLKLMRLKDPSLAFIEAHDLDILKYSCPSLAKVFENDEAADVFIKYLQATHDKPLDTANPVDLFGLLVLAFIRAMISADPSQSLKAKELLEHPLLLAFMKDELGMFKHEQAHVTKALHMQSILGLREEFEKRGSRRRMAVLKNESFPLALNIASRDFTISPDTWHYWLQQYWAVLPQIESTRDEEREQRRGRNRRRRPRKRNGGEGHPPKDS